MSKREEGYPLDLEFKKENGVVIMNVMRHFTDDLPKERVKLSQESYDMAWHMMWNGIADGEIEMYPARKGFGFFVTLTHSRYLELITERKGKENG